MARLIGVLISVGIIGYRFYAQQPFWRPYTSEAGAFTVSMPGPPQEKEKLITASGRAVKLYEVMASRGGTAYAVAYADHPLSPEGASQDTSLLKWYGENSAKLHPIEYREAISMNNYPGLALRYHTNQGIFIRQRIFQVKSRLYQVIVSATNTSANSPNAQRFLDSFRLLKAGSI